MAASEEIEDVTEHLTCPVCFEVPDSEVYQCLDGHVLCKVCYFKLKECPQCRIPLDTTRPIRNRHFEGLLESIKIKCEYYLLCGTMKPKGFIRNHEESCAFNPKFGDFISLCKLFGHSGCLYQVNNGNTEDAVQHLITFHDCVQSKGGNFQMELKDIEVASTLEEITFWTPIITKLDDKQCFILTVAVMDPKKQSVGFVSLFLPYPENPDRRKASFKISFKISYGDPEEDFTLTAAHVPVPLKKASFYLPFNIPSPFQLSWLQEHSTKRNSILIDCKINEMEADEKIVCTKYSVSDTKEEPVVHWESLKRSLAAQELLDNELKGGTDRGAVFVFIQRVFENKKELPGVTNGDLEWLKYGCLFLAAWFGTVNALQYILNQGELNLNVVTLLHETPLHWTLHDANKKVGLRKAKLLLEHVDPRRISQRVPLLHSAIICRADEALKYFLELGLDVNQIDDGGRTAFLVLIENNVNAGKAREEFLVKMTKTFLDKGADCRFVDNLTEAFLTLGYANIKKIQKLVNDHQNGARDA